MRAGRLLDANLQQLTNQLQLLTRLVQRQGQQQQRNHQQLQGQMQTLQGQVQVLQGQVQVLQQAPQPPGVIAEANIIRRTCNRTAASNEELLPILDAAGAVFPGFPLTKLHLTEMTTAELAQALQFYQQPVPAQRRTR